MIEVQDTSVFVFSRSYCMVVDLYPVMLPLLCTTPIAADFRGVWYERARNRLAIAGVPAMRGPLDTPDSTRKYVYVQ